MTTANSKDQEHADERKSTFGPEIDLFTKHIEAIGDALSSMIFAVQEITKQSKKILKQFEGEKCEVTETEGKSTLSVPNIHYREWKRLRRKYEHFDLSRSLLPRSLLVSLISQYDAYLGRLLRTIFLRKPEILNGSDKKISFETLSQFGSLDAVREYMLEKEVEAILRSSHSDQFKWIERTFDLPLTKGLDSWPTFIELTERRNLFVHTDGIISSQYIAVCNFHKCKLEESALEGQRLGVPQKYFRAAHYCIYEIGVKLGHVLWRKLFPDERAQADSHFIMLTYDLLDNGKYELAIRLLDFACEEFKKFSDEENQLTLLVNRAQAYKWKGDEERSKKIIRSIDWSAKGDKFKLAHSVLVEDWDESVSVMQRIGRHGTVSKSDYLEWPLFKNFRKQELFLKAYQDIYGEEFSRKAEIKKKELPASPMEIETEVIRSEPDDAVL